MMQIPTDERSVTDEQVLKAFNLELPQFAAVKAALMKGDIEAAKRQLVEYFHKRTNVNFLFDYRGTPLKPIDPDESPYSFQSSLGFGGSLKELCLRVGRKMMNNTYLLPSGKRGEEYLGDHFQNMIHFNIAEDQGNRHRHSLDMFVRGQFFESMAVLYHEDGDPAVAEHFVEVLNKFFETYPLQIVDTRACANRFQFDEDRDVMSVGWLTIVFTSLLYTELPYAIDYKNAFEIIKRIWFLGIQFRRFDTDSFRPYNHHMWERGLVPFLLGTLLPEIPDFVAMRDHGAQVVCRHVKEDFNESGGYNEHSIAYWSGAAVGEMLYRGVYIARLNNMPLLDEEALSRINNTFNVLASIASPGERYPNLGDNGGPMINPILRLGEKMIDNALCKELLALREGRAQKDHPSLLPLDYCDENTGFACCHSSYNVDENYLLMSVKVNCGYSGHNHMDMLSLFVTMRGEPIFGEPYGGQLYHTIKMGSAQRGYMYNMNSHNSVLAYGKPIAPDSMFCNQWGVYRPDSPVSEYYSSGAGCYIDAYHVGYTFCRHRRKVLVARAGAIIVRDEIERGNRMTDKHIQRWHLEPSCSCRQLNDAALLIEKNGVRLLCIWGVDMQISIDSNSEMLVPAIYADCTELAPVLNISFATPEEKMQDCLMVSLDMLMLDVTGRELPDLQQMTEKLTELTMNMSQPQALAALAALCAQEK